MELRLFRRWLKPTCTIGELFVDGQYECFSLEDQLREDPDPTTPANEAKVPGETAIPAGRYRVVLQKPNRAIWSPHPDGLLPHLVDVPGFTGIYVHAGNRAEDVRGCIAVGNRSLENSITGSRVALEALMAKLVKAKDNIWITVGDPSADPTGSKDSGPGGDGT